MITPRFDVRPNVPAQPPRVSAVGYSRVLASRHKYVGKSPDIKMGQGSLVRRALTGNVSGFRRV